MSDLKRLLFVLDSLYASLGFTNGFQSFWGKAIQICLVWKDPKANYQTFKKAVKFNFASFYKYLLQGSIFYQYILLRGEDEKMPTKAWGGGGGDDCARGKQEV